MRGRCDQDGFSLKVPRNREDKPSKRINLSSEFMPEQTAVTKVDFVTKGRVRQFLQRDGRRWDLIYMGILVSKWEQRSHESQAKDSETAV